MDSISETAARFRSLFQGRTDAWGGEIDPLGQGRAVAVKRPMTLLPWIGHLYGSHPVGVYNAMDGDLCWWSALDFDDDDLAKAVDAAQAYRLFDASPFIERSRRKGWHVWIFHDGPTPLTLARSAGLGVLNLCELSLKTEVYPKQTTIGVDRKYGNFLRLPYPAIDEDNGMHRKVLVDGEALTRDEFLNQATRTPRAALERLAEFAPIVVPATASRAGELIQAALAGTTVRSNQPIAAVAAGTERVPEGQRDNTFFVLAQYLRGLGKTEEEALAVGLRVHATQTDSGFPESAVIEKFSRAFRH